MRCGMQDCNKKIKLAFQFPCKCGIMYCRKHFNDHKCSHDYKGEEAKRLTVAMPAVEVEKMQKI